MGTAVICPAPLSQGPTASLGMCSSIPSAFLAEAKQLLVCFYRWSSKAPRREALRWVTQGGWGRIEPGIYLCALVVVRKIRPPILQRENTSVIIKK